jgi:hypothetical protein
VKFALLVPPPERVLSAGIFMFAARLKELGQNFRFITHPLAAGHDEVLCVSMVTDEPIKVVTRAKKIIAGGSGVLHGGVIESDRPTLYIKGVIDGITMSDLQQEGTISKGLRLTRPLIPLIPKNFLYNTMSICIYSGTGCYHSKCIFCECCDNPFYEVEPGIVARTILECNRLYPGYDVRLSTDSPSNTFFDDLCTEMDKLLKQKYSGIKAEWCSYIRANQATNERMAMLSQAGCQSVAIGAEYFHDDILKYIKKGITVEQILNAHSNAVNNGIIPGLTVIDFDVKDQDIHKQHEEILKAFGGWYVYHSKWEDDPIPF